MAEGRTYNRAKTIDKVLAIDTDAYTANDVVGGLITIAIPDNIGGTIRRVDLIDADNEKAAMTLHFFDQLPSTIVDDAAFAPTIDDLKKRIGVVTIGAGQYRTDNSFAVAHMHDINFDYDTSVNLTLAQQSANATIYAYLVCTATPTYTATTDLTLRVTVWADS